MSRSLLILGLYANSLDKAKGKGPHPLHEREKANGKARTNIHKLKKCSHSPLTQQGAFELNNVRSHHSCQLFRAFSAFLFLDSCSVARRSDETITGSVQLRIRFLIGKRSSKHAKSRPLFCSLSVCSAERYVFYCSGGRFNHQRGCRRCST